MKKCKNCGEELPDSARICPHCGARIKRPIYARWWLWLLVILAAIIIIVALGGDKDEAPPVITNPGDEQVETMSPSPSPDESPGESPGASPSDAGKLSDRTIIAAGQSVTTKNFVVTLEAVNKPEGGEFNEPSEGNEYVELVLVIENISEKDFTVSSMLMFDSYQDGFSINESLSAQIASDIPTMDGALAAGKKLRGKLAYELPKDWEELEIDVDLTALTFSTDGEIKIIVQNR